MSRPRRTLLSAAFLAFASSSLRAQSADASGHWEGAVHAPGREVNIEVDLARNGKGELAGTFTGQNVKGLPLSSVAMEGRSVRFLISFGSATSTFDGVLSADGKSISGELVTPQADHPLPFSVTRSGDPRIDPPAKSAPIGRELEGTWKGALDVNGRQLRFVLKMANQADGTAAGSIANLDEGLEIPITTITQKASTLTLDVRIVGGSYAASINAQGTELVGTWAQGSLAAPLTFRRAAP
jgi:hypothetical protein